MTCKDCIHYEVCKETRIMNPSHNYSTECNDYNDRSRFVELPCNIGDFVYYIIANKVIAEIVTQFTIKRDDLHYDKKQTILQRFNCKDICSAEKIGNRFFLTKQEAENALKGKTSFLQKMKEENND